VVPPKLPYKDSNPFIGDAGFKNPGGFEATDYIPQNRQLVKDQGIEIPALKGDPAGIRIGLKITHDILGNPISGKPDLGAIEIN
jgi:hypothetical protein